MRTCDFSGGFFKILRDTTKLWHRSWCSPLERLIYLYKRVHELTTTSQESFSRYSTIIPYPHLYFYYDFLYCTVTIINQRNVEVTIWWSCINFFKSLRFDSHHVRGPFANFAHFIVWYAKKKKNLFYWYYSINI